MYQGEGAGSPAPCAGQSSIFPWWRGRGGQGPPLSTNLPCSASCPLFLTLPLLTTPGS
jgi:hypothetical protein